MWFEFFVLGSFWFWAFVCFVSALIINSLENHDSGFAASAVLFVALLVLWFFGTTSWISAAFNYMLLHPLIVLAYLAGYIGIGTMYGIYRWWKYCHECLEYAMLAEAQDIKSYQPDISRRMDSFIRWATYWPFLCIWTLLHDPFYRVYRTIAQLLKEALSDIANHVFRNTK